MKNYKDYMTDIKKKSISNISLEQYTGFKSLLRNKSIIVTKSDKVNSMVVMHRS